MTVETKFANQVKTSELWLFLVAVFKQYPQFPTAFLASSGFISVSVYLGLFGINAIDVINTSDIIFNSIVNLILLVPVFFALVLVAVAWVSTDTAIDDANGQAQGTRKVVLFAFALLRSLWLATACLIVLGAVMLWAWPGGSSEALHKVGVDASALQPSNGLWGLLINLAIATLVIWILPIIYAFFTTGLLPKGLLTTIILFVVANAIVGSIAHKLYMGSTGGQSIGFLHRHAMNLPETLVQACPGERDIIWTGDRALVLYCTKTGHRFILYRDYATVVDIR